MSITVSLETGGPLSAKTLERLQQFLQVSGEQWETFARKNTSYGDSFAEHGPVGMLIRMGDKIKRLVNIDRTGINLVDDEGMRDTLMDLATYSIMAIMLLDEEETCRRCGGEGLPSAQGGRFNRMPCPECGFDPLSEQACGRCGRSMADCQAHKNLMGDIDVGASVLIDGSEKVHKLKFVTLLGEVGLYCEGERIRSHSLWVDEAIPCGPEDERSRSCCEPCFRDAPPAP